MAAKNTAAQRGPLGAWAYGTRDLLDASPEDAAAKAGITYPTLRKIEGGSSRQPAKATIYALWQHYRRIGQEKGRPVEDPPPEWRGDPNPVQPTTQTDPLAAISDLVGELHGWRTTDRDRISDLEASVARLTERLRQLERGPAARPTPIVPPATAG